MGQGQHSFNIPFSEECLSITDSLLILLEILYTSFDSCLQCHRGREGRAERGKKKKKKKQASPPNRITKRTASVSFLISVLNTKQLAA